jgi:hypothetical protein
MYIFDKEKDQFYGIEETSFKQNRIRERQDLEKWVIQNPEILQEELLIIHSEYSRFDKTSERPDIVALARDGKIVVIELKLDDSGKSVEFQALKYASYYSNTSFDDLVSLKAENQKENKMEQIRTEMENFITQPEFEQIDDKPRIIIVSKTFRPEVTSTILWLRKFDVDISCVKLTPYKIDENRIGITSQKIIPLPEAEEYLINVQKKENTAKTLTRSQREYLAFYNELIERIREQLPLTLSPPSTRSYYQIRTNPGGIHYEWGFHGRGRTSFGVELHFESSRALNYERIMSLQKKEEQLKEQLGSELVFEKEWGKNSSRVYLEYPSGKMTEELKKWAIENMLKFYKTFQPLLDKM